MKKVIAVLATVIALVAVSCSHPTYVSQSFANVPVTWDNINTSDSAFDSFKISDTNTQLDIVRSLLSEAENRIYDVKDQEQLQVFKSKVLMIERYYAATNKQSVSIENRIRDLKVRISKVEE